MHTRTRVGRHLYIWLEWLCKILFLSGPYLAVGIWKGRASYKHWKLEWVGIAYLCLCLVGLVRATWYWQRTGAAEYFLPPILFYLFAPFLGMLLMTTAFSFALGTWSYGRPDDTEEE